MGLSRRIRAAWRYFTSLGRPSPRRKPVPAVQEDTTAALRRYVNTKRQCELAVSEALSPEKAS